MSLTFSVGFLKVGIVDVIDICLVTALLYVVYTLMRGTVAIKALVGFSLLYFMYLLFKAAEMQLLTLILGQFMGFGVLAVIILFQQELRKFLFLLGGTTSLHTNPVLTRLMIWRRGAATSNKLEVSEVVDAIESLKNSHTGALLVFSKSDDLRFYEESGDAINSVVSKRLLLSIFNKESPLHDGGVIVRGGKIVAARCILPVTEQRDLPSQFGLRHRAAIGITEATNSLVLVVSEETGQIAIAQQGTIEKNLSPQEVRAVLERYLYG